MKKLIFGAAALLALVSCEQQKIGFVDNSELVNEYQEKKDIEEKYKELITDFEKERDSVSQAFQLEYQQASIDAQKMSQKKAQELATSIQQKGQLLSQQMQVKEQEIAQNSQKEIDSLVKKVKSFVSDYGKNNGYTYILGSNDAGSVMYGKEANDLTQTLIDALNKKYESEKN